MELSSSLSKNKNIVLNVVIILVAVYIASGVYKTQNEELNRTLQEKDNETKKNEVMKNIGELENTYAAYKDFLNKKDVNTMIDTFSSMAAAAGVKIVSVKPLPEKTLPTYTEYPFDIKVEAKDYNSLGKFVSSLESSNDIFQLGWFKIRPVQDPKKERSFVLNADVKVTTFLVK